MLEKKEYGILQITDIKKFAENIDDSPYGGGPGMILKAEVLQSAFSNAITDIEKTTKKYKNYAYS